MYQKQKRLREIQEERQMSNIRKRTMKQLRNIYKLETVAEKNV